MTRRIYEKHAEAHHQNSSQVYALVIGQCSQALWNRMEASKRWNHINEASDIMELFQLVQNCMIQQQTCQKLIHSLLDTEAQVYSFRQKDLMNNKYYKKFKDLVTNAEWLGSEIRAHLDRVETILEEIAHDPDMPRENKPMIWLAVLFLMNSDKNWYGSLVHDIKNKYTRGSDMYPTILSAAYNDIVNYQPDSKSSNQDPDLELLYQQRIMMAKPRRPWSWLWDSSWLRQARRTRWWPRWELWLQCNPYEQWTAPYITGTCSL
jgi:hypothetical protein